MFFHSIEFAILFFFAILFNYLATSSKLKIFLLLIISLIFYSYSASEFLIYLLVSIFITYFCAKKINSSKFGNYFFYFSIIFNITLLLFFKLQSKIIPALVSIIPNNFQFSFILPLGISFYVFQAISYTIDVKNKVIDAEKDFSIYALYIAYFPNLIAGPIERYGQLTPQLVKKSEFKYSNFKTGGLYFLIGLIKKLIIADRFEFLSKNIIANWHTLNPIVVMIGGYFVVFYFYFDFSAYSQMAKGLAYMLDIKLVDNFNSPLWSSSPIEFWRRWHISLMNWLVDYIFVPLIKLDFSFSNAIAANFIIFLIIGLWHGVDLNYALWGLVNAIVVALNMIYRKYFGKKEKSKFKPIKIILTFHYFVLNGMLIYLPNISSLLVFTKRSYLALTTNFKSLLDLSYLSSDFSKLDVKLSMILLLCILIGEKYFENKSFIELFNKLNPAVRWCIYTMSILILILFSFSGVKNYAYVRF